MANIPALHNVSECMSMITMMVEMADTANALNIGTYDSWQNQLTNRVVETRSTFLGDPTRVSQGIPSTVLQTTTVEDPYLTFMKAVLHIDETDFSNTTYEETFHEYSLVTPLVAIPSKTTTNKYAPILMTFDWDVALADSTEVKPIYRLYNVVEGARNAYTMLINVLCTKIVSWYSFSAVLTFAGYNNSGTGYINLEKWFQEYGFSVDESLKTACRDIRERTNLIEHITQRLRNQLFPNVDMKTIATALVHGVKESSQGIDKTTWEEMLVVTNRFNSLQQMCRQNPTMLLRNTLVSTKSTTYNLLGPISTVAYSSASLNDAGGTYQLSNSVQTTVSEGILKMVQPLKRNVMWPTGDALGQVISGGNDGVVIQYNRIQLPTTNWDDVKRAYQNAPKTVYQRSKSYTFVADTMYEAVSDFYSSIRRLGLKSASMSYDCEKSRGTYDVSYTYASS